MFIRSKKVFFSFNFFLFFFLEERDFYKNTTYRFAGKVYKLNLIFVIYISVYIIFICFNLYIVSLKKKKKKKVTAFFLALLLAMIDRGALRPMDKSCFCRLNFFSLKK